MSTIWIALTVLVIGIFWIGTVGALVAPARIVGLARLLLYRISKTRVGRLIAFYAHRGRSEIDGTRARFASWLPHRADVLDPGERVAAGRSAMQSLTEIDPGLPLEYPMWPVSGSYGRKLSKLVDQASALPAAELLGRPGVVLANAMCRTDRFADGGALYDAAIEASPDDADLRVSRGIARLSVKRYADALTDLETAARLDGMTASGYAAIGDAYWASDRIDQALDAYEKGLAVKPGHTWLEGRRAQAHAASGRHAEAIAVLEQLPWPYRQSGKVRRMVARSHEALGDTRAALAELDRVLMRNPGDLDARMSRALLLAQDGQTDAALRDAEQIAERRPDAQSIAYRAGLLNEVGRTTEAIQIARKAVEDYPAEVYPHLVLAYVLAKSGQPHEALTVADQGCELGPKNVRTFATRAEILRRLGRLEEALQDVDRVAELDPGSTTTLGLRAAILEELGRYDEALDALTREMDDAREPDSGRLVGLAYVLARLGRTAEAAAAITGARSLDDLASPGLIHLALSEALIDQPLDARRTLDLGLALPHEPAGDYNAACVLALLGEPDRCLDLLASALAADPTLASRMDQDQDLESLRRDRLYGARLESLAADAGRRTH